MQGIILFLKKINARRVAPKIFLHWPPQKINERELLTKKHLNFMQLKIPHRPPSMVRPCLVPVGRFLIPYRSIHFDDVSEANGRKTLSQKQNAHACVAI